jgi:hypothetical protein
VRGIKVLQPPLQHLRNDAKHVNITHIRRVASVATKAQMLSRNVECSAPPKIEDEVLAFALDCNIVATREETVDIYLLIDGELPQISSETYLRGQLTVVLEMVVQISFFKVFVIRIRIRHAPF